MPSKATSDRKPKPTEEEPEAVVSTSSDDQRKSKVRRVSTNANASACLNGNALMTAGAASTSDIASNSSAFTDEEEEDEDMAGVGKLIQDLAHSDNARVNTALDALNLELKNDDKKRDAFTFVGGCAALVHLVKDRLKKAMKKVPACDQVTVTEVNEFPELETMEKTLDLIVNFTSRSASRLLVEWKQLSR
jgi:hypothetical protein